MTAENTKDPIQLDDALKYAEDSCETRHPDNYYVRDFPFKKMVVIRDTLRALQSQPAAAHGLGDLTYAEFLDANKRRQKDWPSEKWVLAEWMTALTGEVGEAANIIKKVFRGDMTLDDAREKLGKELADINTYLTIVADKIGIDLAAVSIEKFNEVSRRPDVNSDVFINVRSKDTLRGECPNRGKPCSCTNENNCVTQEPPQINAHKLNIHILLDVLSCAAKGEPIDPEQCESVAGIVTEYDATDFTAEDIQALYDCGPKLLPADKQAALDELQISNIVKHAFFAGKNGLDWVDYEPHRNYQNLISALTAPQPVADLDGLKEEVCTALNYTGVILRPIAYKIMGYLHATGRLNMEDPWQPIETAPKDGTWFLGLIEGTPYKCKIFMNGNVVNYHWCMHSNMAQGQTLRIEKDDSGNERRVQTKEEEDARYEPSILGYKRGMNHKPTHWMPYREPTIAKVKGE